MTSHAADVGSFTVTVVGSSGSCPGPGVPGSCLLVQAVDDTGRTWRLVLDVGTGAFAELRRYCDPGDVDAVFLTHLHPDHCLDLVPWQVWGAYGPGARGSTRCPVWGPTGAHGRIARAYAPGAEISPLLGVFEWCEWQVGVSVTVGPVDVVPIPAWHSVPACGFRLSFAGRTVVVTGDTDLNSDVVGGALDADLLVAECGFASSEASVRGVHLTPERVAELASTARAQRVLLTHVPPWGSAEAALAACAALGVPASMARPGMTIAV